LGQTNPGSAWSNTEQDPWPLQRLDLRRGHGDREDPVLDAVEVNLNSLAGSLASDFGFSSSFFDLSFASLSPLPSQKRRARAPLFDRDLVT